MSIEQSLREFVDWWRANIKGYEKREAQVFLDRLLQAFGHDGAIEAGGTFEPPIQHERNGKTTVEFADYLIPNRVLIEMKKRGEDLKKHYTQLEKYWKRLDYSIRPNYAILCNFDEIWIYNLPHQFYEPVEKVRLDEIHARHAALSFLSPGPYRVPVFKDNRVEVTKDAAFQLAELMQSLEEAVDDKEIALRFTLQCMIALFAEDVGLLPPATLLDIVEDSRQRRNATDNSHDLMALLFTMMNYPKHARRAGRFGQVDYFNGGIFQQVHPVFLSGPQLHRLESACRQDWSKIRPSIFGNIFEYSMDKRERHREGAHYTTELDIKRIVDPVIAEPWRDDIESVNTLPDALALYDKLCDYIVLDPACGSGNFLYVAYREMKALESELRDQIAALGGDLSQLKRRVTANQFHGYDINEFAVELAKVSLMIAKKLAVDEFDTDENPLPLDNLDENIKAEDALFNEWVDFDACIGNPPYMGGKVQKQEHSLEYINAVRDKFPDVPGNADYCVYWFRKAHDNMQDGDRAGLVGTNTIRQNYSRIGSLDYIVDNGGVIYDAVSSLPWSGEANVHVSIANWAKGEPPLEPNRLHFFAGVNDAKENIVRTIELGRINGSLSDRTDVSDALQLTVNRKPKRVYQGQVAGNHHFIFEPNKAISLIRRDQSSQSVLFPFLIGRDLTSNHRAQPSRYIMDLGAFDIVEAQSYRAAIRHIRKHILPIRRVKAKEEHAKNESARRSNPKARLNHHHNNFLNQWWKLSYGRNDMLQELSKIVRCIVCSEVTKRPIFDFMSTEIRPDHSIQVFAFEDDYTFGILQSNAHWQWFTVEKASTLTESDWRYTPHSVFDTFPFPQHPASDHVKAVAHAGRALHEYRRQEMERSESGLNLRDMYRTLELPGTNPLRDLHEALDAAVLAAYGFDPDRDILEQLLALNLEVAAKIEAGEPVTAPGIPPDYPEPAELISDGCIQPPDLI